MANIFTLDFHILNYTLLGSSATVQVGILTFFFPHRISLESYDKPRETAILRGASPSQQAAPGEVP